MAACARLVRPLYELMLVLALQSKVLGTDDTTVKLRDNQLDHTRTAYFWASLRPGRVLRVFGGTETSR